MSSLSVYPVSSPELPNKVLAHFDDIASTLAEQGVIGLLLFLGPVGYWLAGTVKALPRLPRTGFISRQLLWSLWLVILGHVIVNNFSRMQVQFGLGMWWVVLGLIASIVVRAGRSEIGVADVERVR